LPKRLEIVGNVDVRIEMEINSLHRSCGTTGERVERSVPYPPSFLGGRYGTWPRARGMGDVRVLECGVTNEIPRGPLTGYSARLAALVENELHQITNLFGKP
jgi:hypothetical protein